MDKDGCSCGCIVSLFVGALILWGISCNIAVERDYNPVVVFVVIIASFLGVLFLIGLLFERIGSKRIKRYQAIQTKYPKAFAKYLEQEGHSDPQSVPDTFKQKVLKRQEIIWENEEIAINNEETIALKRKEEEKLAEENRKIGNISLSYPNGFRIWKEKNPNCTNDFLIRTQYYIEKEENDFQEKLKLKKLEEEKVKAGRRIQLQSEAYTVLTLKVVQWELLRPGFYYTWLFYYYPTTCDFEPAWQDRENRKTVWNFKNDPERHIQPAIHDRVIDIIVSQIKQKLIKTFGEDYVQFLTLVCLPASTAVKNQARYEEFSKRLCEATGMENGFNHIHITKDGISKNDPGNKTGKSIQPEVSFDNWFKEKYVLLFDDIVTKGETMLKYKSNLGKMGATVIGGICIGKTKHERPIQQRIVNLDEYDLPF